MTGFGPVTTPPAGANQVVVQVCTTVPCTVGTMVSSPPQTGPGPLAPPPGVAVNTITGVRFVFTNSAGTPLPYDPTGGTVPVGLVLRETLRSNGAPNMPTVRDEVPNTATPEAVDPWRHCLRNGGDVACFDINPNIARVTTTKEFFSDTDHNYAANGQAIAGQTPGAGVSIRLAGTNKSGFGVAFMEIREPDPAVPGAVAAFAQMNTTEIRFQRPNGATSTTVTVTCRGGAVVSQTYTQSALTPVAISPTFCPAGVFPAIVSVRYTGTDPEGNGTIANEALGRLHLTGNLLTSTPPSTLSNCGLSTVDNPVNSTAPAATATVRRNLTVVPPTGSLGPGTKTSGRRDVIVPGQPLTFSLASATPATSR